MRIASAYTRTVGSTICRKVNVNGICRPVHLLIYGNLERRARLTWNSMNSAGRYRRNQNREGIFQEIARRHTATRRRTERRIDQDGSGRCGDLGRMEASQELSVSKKILRHAQSRI